MTLFLKFSRNFRIFTYFDAIFEILVKSSVAGSFEAGSERFFERVRLASPKSPQNIDGGKSLVSVLNAVPKLVRSRRMPEKRNDRMR